VSGQPPQRRVVRAVLAVGRVGVGSLGDEQQRAVGQEPRAALAVGRPGEPGGGPPAASIRQMLVTYFFLSGLSDWTVAASQLPSGDSRRPVIRGMAT
jgi:hypothetical protein